MAAETHNGNLNRSKVVAKPSAGATRAAGKSDSCDEALGNPGRFVGETVTTLPVEGNGTAAYDAMEKQNDGNVLIVTEKQEEALRTTRKALNKRSL
jgi:regulator of RNase E activity RraA